MNVNNIYLLDHQQISAGNVYRNLNSSPSVMQMKSGLHNDSNSDKVIFKVESDHLTPANNFKMNSINTHNLTSNNNHLNTYGIQTNGLKVAKNNELMRAKETSKEDAHVKTEDTDMSVPNSLNIYVNNVVCSYSTQCHLNLRRIAMDGMHVEYKKENGVGF